MGEEADRLIQRMLDGPTFGQRRVYLKKPPKPLPVGAPLKMENMTSDHIVSEKAPRMMSEEMKRELATLSETQRAVRILAFNEDISAHAASQKYNSYTAMKRREAEREAELQRLEEQQRWYRAKFQEVQEAKTVEDLKGLLQEVIEQLWGPK